MGPYRTNAQGQATWTWNWPLALVLCVLIISVVILSLARAIPQDVLTHIIVFLMGLAVPSQAIATRTRTFYSMHPPPMHVDSDRPEPDVETPKEGRRRF